MSFSRRYRNERVPSHLSRSNYKYSKTDDWGNNQPSINKPPQTRNITDLFDIPQDKQGPSSRSQGSFTDHRHFLGKKFKDQSFNRGGSERTRENRNISDRKEFQRRDDRSHFSEKRDNITYRDERPGSDYHEFESRNHRSFNQKREFHVREDQSYNNAEEQRMQMDRNFDNDEEYERKVYRNRRDSPEFSLRDERNNFVTNEFERREDRGYHNTHEIERGDHINYKDNNLFERPEVGGFNDGSVYQRREQRQLLSEFERTDDKGYDINEFVRKDYQNPNDDNDEYQRRVYRSPDGNQKFQNKSNRSYDNYEFEMKDDRHPDDNDFQRRDRNSSNEQNNHQNFNKRKFSGQNYHTGNKKRFDDDSRFDAPSTSQFGPKESKQPSYNRGHQFNEDRYRPIEEKAEPAQPSTNKSNYVPFQGVKQSSRPVSFENDDKRYQQQQKPFSKFTTPAFDDHDDSFGQDFENQEAVWDLEENIDDEIGLGQVSEETFEETYEQEGGLYFDEEGSDKEGNEDMEEMGGGFYKGNIPLPPPEIREKFKFYPPSPEEMGQLFKNLVIFYFFKQPKHLKEKNPFVIICESFRRSPDYHNVDVHDGFNSRDRAMMYCTIRYCDMILTRGMSSYKVKKEARVRAAVKLINVLAQRCYTLKMKGDYYGKEAFNKRVFEQERPGLFKVVPIETVAPLEPNRPREVRLQEITDYLKAFAQKNTDLELIFTSLDKLDPIIVKTAAKQLNLSFHRMGSHLQYTTVYVTRPPTYWRDKILATGKLENERYQLIPPLGEGQSLISANKIKEFLVAFKKRMVGPAITDKEVTLYGPPGVGPKIVTCTSRYGGGRGRGRGRGRGGRGGRGRGRFNFNKRFGKRGFKK